MLVEEYEKGGWKHFFHHIQLGEHQLRQQNLWEYHQKIYSRLQVGVSDPIFLQFYHRPIQSDNFGRGVQAFSESHIFGEPWDNTMYMLWEPLKCYYYKDQSNLMRIYTMTT